MKLKKFLKSHKIKIRYKKRTNQRQPENKETKNKSQNNSYKI